MRRCRICPISPATEGERAATSESGCRTFFDVSSRGVPRAKECRSLGANVTRVAESLAENRNRPLRDERQHRPQVRTGQSGSLELIYFRAIVTQMRPSQNRGARFRLHQADRDYFFPTELRKARYALCLQSQQAVLSRSFASDECDIRMITGHW